MGVTAAGVIISEQTYGGKIDAGQVAYLKSDGKWYLARANSGATSAGDLAIALDSGVAGGKGRLVKLGYVNNTAWSWTPGAPLYLSAATAGGLTQTRPTGAGNVVREVATVASDPSTIYFDPSPSSGPLATVEGLTAEKGDLIIGQAGAWAKLPVSTDPLARLRPNSSAASGLEWGKDVPELLNRVVYETDGVGNTLEIHEVWIPQFKSKYWSQENLNNLDCGGFWIDKYQACMFDATGSSHGSVSANNPGLNGAACKPHVVPWSDINWSNARAAVENRGGAANKATGTCAPYSGGSTTQFYAENAGHLIGRRVYITQGDVTYVRRVVRTGGDTTADPNAAKLVEFYPALPAPVTSDDEYTIVRRFLPGGYEWFSLAALARILMVECGLPYCKGNTDWGKFHGDPRERVYEGIPDPVRPGYSGNAIARTLTGSGPLSWSLNGKESGVWDLKGNVWEWVDLRIGTAANHTIDAEYPGAGHLLPSTNGRVQALYDPAPDGARSLGAEIFAPKTIGSAQAEFDSNYYYQNTGQRAAVRGGSWGIAARAGLFYLTVYGAPSYVFYNIGFRGVC